MGNSKLMIFNYFLFKAVSSIIIEVGRYHPLYSKYNLKQKLKKEKKTD